jgi:hypothetical protein
MHASASLDLEEITFEDTEPETEHGALSHPLTLGIATQSVAATTTSTLPVAPDDYLDRLVKYIPAEIVALYLGVSNVVPSSDTSYWTALWIITFLTTLCTPIYMYFATAEKGQPPLWTQIIISSIAFPIWVFAIGGPFRHFSWYNDKHWIAAIVISFTTFAVGMVKPKSSPAPQP